MTGKSHVHHEQRALTFALYGVVFFVVLALGFALLTNSDAILFDGIYSLIAFCVALLTLRVAKLAERPDDDKFHFGYTAMEPTLNLFKSLFILVACVYALTEAVKRLLAGGTEAAYGLAVLYGALATVGCFTVAALMYRVSRQHRSDLVEVESRTWFVDGMLSGAVLLGFLGAWYLEHSPWAEWAPLVDPVLLIAIVLFALPIPLGILRDSLKEIVNMAPPQPVVEDIEQRLLDTLGEVEYDHVELRVTKRGRNTYLLVHVVVAEAFSIRTVAELDAIRRASEHALKTWNPEIVMDMLFVRDEKLAW
ncbi:cation diffusion facilitator family transporter [Parahaliea maris]|uniref:Cation diffusion facilitator family transporter n=1 Tax=Parahaliea maris TaxID=2716870 RepID=A0A5C9A957_9GAMM|nr:cation diffusion facilitator family transporter [Parahaliea maris]TXS95771.1 cation diffusion facilitator family transporter [Parahaliea maris]